MDVRGKKQFSANATPFLINIYKREQGRNRKARPGWCAREVGARTGVEFTNGTEPGSRASKLVQVYTRVNLVPELTNNTKFAHENIYP